MSSAAAVRCLGIVLCLALSAVWSNGEDSVCCFPSEVSGKAADMIQEWYKFYTDFEENWTFRSWTKHLQEREESYDSANGKLYRLVLAYGSEYCSALNKQFNPVRCIPASARKMKGVEGTTRYEFDDEATRVVKSFDVRHIDDQTCVPVVGNTHGMHTAFSIDFTFDTQEQTRQLRGSYEERFQDIKDQCSEGK